MPTRVADKLLAWGVGHIDEKALEQAVRSSRLPFVSGHVALMPDAHYGLGATIGSVIPTRGAIIPAAVGVDIGCGMIAVETNLTASDLPDDLGPLLSRLEKKVPAGVGRGHGRRYTAGVRWLLDNPNPAVDEEIRLVEKTCGQFGSLGAGNHFVEVCLEDDEDQTVWVVLHSGSRGVGNLLARRHIDIAKGLMKERFISLEDPDLAYLVEKEPSFEAYLDDLHWAQDYAYASREQMMNTVLTELQRALCTHAHPEDEAVCFNDFTEVQRVNCHHNYTAKEHHHGKDLWITRKGAIRAREGDLGVVPGSMGTSTFIVRGLGSAASYTSAAHGAGRQMSRTQARKTLTVASLEDAMAETTWLKGQGKALLDEHPDSYKDVNQVMRAQADLVEVVAELRQVLNYKGL